MLYLTFQNVIRFFKSFLHISLLNPLYRLKKGLFLNGFLGIKMIQWNVCGSREQIKLPLTEGKISKIRSTRTYQTLGSNQVTLLKAI